MGFTPVMNRKEVEECMSKFLDKVIVNGVHRYSLRSRLKISLSRQYQWNPEEQRFIISDAGRRGSERNNS